MKELLLTLRVRNNRLIERRLALGMTQAEIALAIGVSLGTYVQLEKLAASPLNKSDTWRQSALLIAEYDVAPEELWTSGILGVRTAMAERRIDANEARALIGEQTQMMSAGPEANETTVLAHKLLGEMSPREASVLRARFGFDGDDPTLIKVGAETPNYYTGEIGISKQAVAIIEAQALRQIRQKFKRQKFKDNIEDEILPSRPRIAKQLRERLIAAQRGRPIQTYCSAIGPQGHSEKAAWECVQMPGKPWVLANLTDSHGGHIITASRQDGVTSLLQCKICRRGYQMKRILPTPEPP